MTTNLLTALLAIFLIHDFCSRSSMASSEEQTQLHRSVSKIYIENKGLEGYGDKSTQYPMALQLERELSQRGYTIVASNSDADATIKGFCNAQITLDNEDPQDPDFCKCIFELQWRNNKKLWRASAKILTKGMRWEEMDQKIAVIMAGRLDKAIKAAARKSERQKATTR